MHALPPYSPLDVSSWTCFVICMLLLLPANIDHSAECSVLGVVACSQASKNTTFLKMEGVGTDRQVMVTDFFLHWEASLQAAVSSATGISELVIAAFMIHTHAAGSSLRTCSKQLWLILPQSQVDCVQSFHACSTTPPTVAVEICHRARGNPCASYSHTLNLCLLCNYWVLTCACL